MSFRLIDIRVPEQNALQIVEMLESNPLLDLWQNHISDEKVVIRAVVPTDQTEPIMDELQERFSGVKDFRLLLIPVNVFLPRPEAEVPQEKLESRAEKEGVGKKKSRFSREELYAEAEKRVSISKVYISLVVLSTVVAVVGLIKSNVAVLIGAMVIAPLLGPYVALSLATTLADPQLGRTALKAAGVGIGIALIFSALLGFFLGVDPEAPEIASRTQVGFSDIALALASGSAGAFAFTTGISTALVGVMVAVSLLPPLVTSGLLLGAAHFSPAYGALLLLLANIICVNLAGVITFVFQGVRPRRWWEAEKAKRSTRLAILAWSALVVLLGAVILVANRP